MKNYSYNVAWSEADEENVATSSEFPGLSALAGTPEEAVRELQEAIDVAIDAYRSDGEPIPEPQFLSDFSGQFRLRIPKSQHAALSLRAETEGVSLNTLLLALVAEGCGRRSPQPANEPAKSTRTGKRKAVA